MLVTVSGIALLALYVRLGQGQVVSQLRAHPDGGDGDGDGVDGAADDGVQVPGQHPLRHVPAGRP